MIDVLLWGIVIVLVLDKLFFNEEDNLARKAINELADKQNLRVEYYPFSKEVLVFIKDISKEMKRIDEKYEVGEMVLKSTDQKIEKMKEFVDKRNQEVADGVSALAKHFGVEIQTFHKSEEKGFKIIKIKNNKKK